MSTAQRRSLVGLSLCMAMLLGVLGALTAMRAVGAPALPAERLTLVARGMAFYLEGHDTPNPVLELPLGRRVRIQLRNEDVGSVHDLVIPALGLQLEPVRAGEARSVVVRVPDEAASADPAGYWCSFHPVMMRGQVRLVGPQG